MRILPLALLAGVGSIALAGAVAAQEPSHTMTVRLPDGTVEQIRYSGPVAPQVSFTPVAPMTSEQAAFWGDDRASSSPFALMQQVSAEMDQQMTAMLQQAQALMAAPLAVGNGTIPAAIQNLPPGAQSYSLIATITPRGVCSQSVEITARGAGAAPRVVSHRAGNCGAAPATNVAVPDEGPAARLPQHRPHLYSAKATQARPWPHYLEVANLRGY